MRLRSTARRVVRPTLEKIVQFSALGAGSGPRITRYTMYRRLAEIAPSPPPGASVLSISHSVDLCRLLGLDRCHLVEANYPEVNILDLPFADQEFDYVVSDQVFEHIEGDPFRAMAETIRVLKPGGVLVHTTCFINPVHGEPSDFWRYTPDALRLLVGDDAQVIEVSGWGSPIAWLFIFLGLRWTPVPNAQWHPLNMAARFNLSKWPITTWLVARRR